MSGVEKNLWAFHRLSIYHSVHEILPVERRLRRHRVMYTTMSDKWSHYNTHAQSSSVSSRREWFLIEARWWWNLIEFGILIVAIGFMGPPKWHGRYEIRDNWLAKHHQTTQRSRIRFVSGLIQVGWVISNESPLIDRDTSFVLFFCNKNWCKMLSPKNNLFFIFLILQTRIQQKRGPKEEFSEAMWFTQLESLRKPMWFTKLCRWYHD